MTCLLGVSYPENKLSGWSNDLDSMLTITLIHDETEKQEKFIKDSFGTTIEFSARENTKVFM